MGWNRIWVVRRERIVLFGKVIALIVVTFTISFLLTRLFMGLFSAGWR